MKRHYLLLFLLLLTGRAWSEGTNYPRITASSETEEFPAATAMDGDFQTRWSSGFNDDEWWQVEFETPRELGGLVINWEDAFGEKYRIEMSDDGQTWRSVFEEDRGDGGSDLIYFAPVTTRWVRVHGLQRATGWGFSIWEVSFLAAELRPVITADTALSDHPAEQALDGRMETGWRSEPQAQAMLSVQFPQAMNLGGILLRWRDDYARTFTIHGLTTNNVRLPLHHREYGNGEWDYILFDEVQLSRIEFLFKEGARENGFEIREIQFKGLDEKATPLRKVMGRAMDTKKSWFPLWLNREQEFWTITGVPGGSGRSLLSEMGTVEPYKKSFTVMPFLLNGQDLFSWDDAVVRQELEDGDLPLPRVVWEHADWSLEIKPVTFGSADELNTLVRYRVTNKKRTTQSLRLGLAVLPVQLNPSWQHGGLSPIREARWEDRGEGSALVLNDQVRLVLQERPRQRTVLSFEEGDAARSLSQGLLAGRREAKDAQGLLSAALWYSMQIPPEESRDLHVLFPLYRGASETWPWENTAAEYESQLAAARAFWRETLDRVKIQIPEPKLVQIMKSNLAYLLIEQEGPWLKPGTRFYNSSWIRDGALMGLTLLQMGQVEPVKQYAEAYEKLIHSDGWVPWICHENGKPVAFQETGGEGHEYDSQGIYAFLIRNLYDYLGDKAWLAKRYSNVKKSLNFGIGLRRKRMTPDYANGPLYGLVPESNSHEGYFPAQHSYWDNFCLLRGLDDGAYLADVLGRREEATAWRDEAQAYRCDISNSLECVMARDGLDYLPGCVEKGDFDSTSTAIAYTIGDGLDWLPEPFAQQTFDIYYEGFVRRLIPGGRSSYSPYEARTAQALMRRGESERALNLLRFLAADAVLPAAWNGMAEVVHVRPRVPAYIGDMPHGWVGSEFVSAMRALFAFEVNNRLVVAGGLDESWWRQGMSVQNLPTHFGTLHYEVRSSGNVLEMDVSGNANPAGGFEIPMPGWFRQAQVEVNGLLVAPTDRRITFPSVPAQIRITFPKAVK